MLTVATVGTISIWLAPAVVFTVIEVPLTAVTSPVKTVRLFGWPLGEGRGLPLGEGRGLPPASGLNPPPGAAHPLALFGESRTVVAVIEPLESLGPIATMHTPAVMSARDAVEAFVI